MERDSNKRDKVLRKVFCCLVVADRVASFPQCLGPKPRYLISLLLDPAPYYIV
jgi:hypothetical protein